MLSNDIFLQTASDEQLEFCSPAGPRNLQREKGTSNGGEL